MMMSDTNDTRGGLTDISLDALTPDDIRDLVATRIVQCRTQIQATLAEISRLQSLHNSVSLICRIPTELLSIIFSYLQSGVGTNSDLIVASHVCKHWRAVAIGDPCLWSSFAAHHPDGVEEFLMRSEPTLLSISQTRFATATTAKLLNTAAHRIRSLHIAMPRPSAITVVLLSLTAPAPNLEELDIKNTSGANDGDEPDNSAVRLQQPIFSGHVPLLRSLVLHDVSFVVRPSSALVHLDLLTRALDLPSLTTMFGVFRACPGLETVNLTGRCNRDEYVGLRSEAKVSLRSLRSLNLIIHPDVCIPRILAVISLPTQTKLRLYSPISASIFHLTPERTLTHASSLLCLEGLRRLQVTWSTHHAQIRADHYMEDTLQRPALDMEFFHNTVYPRPGLLGKWRFDTSCIEVLVLTGATLPGAADIDHPSIPIALWIMTLESLPVLRTLRVVTLLPHYTSGLLNALQSRPNGIDLLCPRLRALEFVRVDLPASSGQNELHDVLLARSSEQEGMGLERIELSDCPIVLPVALRTTLKQRGVEIDMGED